MEDVLVVMIVFGTIFGVIYLIATGRNKERMALIERGVDASIFEGKKKSDRLKPLKMGLLFVGVGGGIFLGYFLETYADIPAPIPYFAMIFLLGGLALIAFYTMERKMRQNGELPEED